MTQIEMLNYIISEIRYLREKIDKIDASVLDIGNRLNTLETEVSESRPLVSRYKSYLLIAKDIAFFLALMYSIISIAKG